MIKKLTACLFLAATAFGSQSIRNPENGFIVTGDILHYVPLPSFHGNDEILTSNFRIPITVLTANSADRFTLKVRLTGRLQQLNSDRWIERIDSVIEMAEAENITMNGQSAADVFRCLKLILLGQQNSFPCP